MSVARLVLLLIASLVWPLAANSTLIITVCRPNEVYVASDSLTTLKDDSQQNLARSYQYPKVFLVTNEFVAYVFNWAGLQFMDRNSGRLLGGTLPTALESACKRESSNQVPKQAKIDAIIGDFSSRYALDIASKRQESPGSVSTGGFTAGLVFVGCDTSGTNFFLRFGIFAETKILSPKDFQFGHLTTSIPFGFAGETNFPTRLTNGDTNVALLASEDCRATIQAIRHSASDISEQRMVDCILEIFRLHKAHAARLHYDGGEIGEPYDIYRITKDGIKKVH